MTSLELARAERLAFADFLVGLTPEQWAAPSLCQGWTVRDVADRSTADLVGLLRANAVPSRLGAGFGGRVALTDNMIHQQDIRRPLGLARTIPAERLGVALDFVRYAPTIRGAWRVRGLRLVATDLDWTHGKGGPELRGAAEALLMTMAGRPNALLDLVGPGVPVLAARL